MSLDTNTTIDNLKARNSENKKVVDSEDISGNVTEPIDDLRNFTLYLKVSGAVDITVELSPDDGSNWYEPADDSPVEFSGSGTDIVLIRYQANKIRLTGSNGTDVTAQVREVV